MWLSPPDPWKNHNIARGLQHSGTGEWFVQGNTFSEWKAYGPGSLLLWVHGLRLFVTQSSFLETDGFLYSGCGKKRLMVR